VDTGLHAKAIAVFRVDLAQGGGRPGPANPWALRGLLSSLEASGASREEVEATRADLLRAR
jgi:hypothetical protein